jgi:hypothetical protein
MNLSRTYYGPPIMAQSDFGGVAEIPTGATADTITPVPGEPDFVTATFYVRCMTMENVKVPKDSFDRPEPKPSLAKRARDAVGRFVSAG